MTDKYECSNCRFYRYPHCRRHAPIGNGESMNQVTGGIAVWPQTGWNDWCGDFERKPPNAWDASGTIPVNTQTPHP